MTITLRLSLPHIKSNVLQFSRNNAPSHAPQKAVGMQALHLKE